MIACWRSEYGAGHFNYLFDAMANGPQLQSLEAAKAMSELRRLVAHKLETALTAEEETIRIFIKEQLSLAAKATMPEQADALIATVEQERAEYLRMMSRSKYPTRLQTDIFSGPLYELRFWQEYLHHRQKGDLVQQRRALESMAGREGLNLLPRSELLKLISETDSQIRSQQNVTSTPSELEQIAENLLNETKTIEDIAKLCNELPRNTSYSTRSIVEPLIAAYDSLERKDYTRVINNALSIPADRNKVEHLREQFIKSALPHYLEIPELQADPATPLSGILDSHAKSAAEKNQWKAVYRVLDIKLQLQRSSSGRVDPVLVDDIAAVKDFMAGQNAVTAQLWERATQNFLAALDKAKNLDLAPATVTYLETIQRNHPVAFEAGQKPSCCGSR